MLDGRLLPGSVPLRSAARQRRSLRHRSPRGLTRINEPGVDLVLWQRSLSVALGHWLQRLPKGQLPQGRVLAPSAILADALAGLFEASGTPEGPGTHHLREDIMDLAERFARIAGSEIVDVSLDAVEDNACWKFHRDYVPLRLVTTYLGCGTQTVAPRFTARALREQRAYDGPMVNVAAGAVALFKGCASDPEAGVVHRSPPIEGSGITRLVLTLNLPSAASPPLWSQ